MLSCDMDGEGSGTGHHFTPLGLCLFLIPCLPLFLSPPGVKPSSPGILWLLSGALHFLFPAVPILWLGWALLIAGLCFPTHPLLPA